MRQTTFGFSVPGDEKSVRDLLSEAGLPSQDIHRHLSRIIVAKRGDRVVGCAGLELMGKIGLLRSLAVDAWSPVIKKYKHRK